MSLTNPNTVVTEERLNDFYKGILPYLGGMPEMVANKFSKGDIFSTVEKMIGQWTDGKPIYQKTVYTATLNASGTDTVIVHGISNLDHVINAFGYTYGGAGTARRSVLLPYYNSGNWQCSIYVNDVNVVIQVGSSFYNAHKDHGAYVTIQYTKSTDSAISIGDANDYSTEEKIVGTWIDGKPIYQKTVTGTVPNGQFTDDVIGWLDLGINISNIDKFLNIAGYIYDTVFPTVWYNDGHTYFCRVVTDHGNVGRFGIQCNRASFNEQNYSVTLQYTKTTN